MYLESEFSKDWPEGLLDRINATQAHDARLSLPDGAAERLSRRLRRGAELAAAAMFAAMFGAFVIQVVTRYVLHSPAGWTLEFATLAYVWVVFFAAAFLLQRSRAHRLRHALPRRRARGKRRVLAIAQSLILLVTFLIALPGTVDYVTFMSRERTWILQIPFSLAFSCFVLFMVMVILRSGLQDLAPAGPRLAGRARMSLELALMFVLFFGLSAIGLPIGFAMISSGIAFLALDGRDLGLVADQIMNNLYRSFVLLAVPLFIFAADVMNLGSISDRLLEFAHAAGRPHPRRARACRHRRSA